MSGFEEEVPFPIPFAGLRTAGLNLPQSGTGLDPANLPLNLGQTGQAVPSTPGGLFPGAVRARNVSLTPDGGAYCRLGSAGATWTANLRSLSSGNEMPAGVWDFKKSSGTVRKTVCATTERLFDTEQLRTVLKSGLTGSGYADFATFRNQCIHVNGADTPQVWDGAAATASNLIQKIWSTHTALPVAQSAGAIFVLPGDPDGKVHMVGGKAGTGTYSAIHQELDPFLGVWRARPLCGSGADQLNGGAISLSGFVFGGYTSATTITGASWKWDDALGTWKAIAPMIAAKSNHACFVAGTTEDYSVYECGGNTAPSESAPADSSTCARYNDVAFGSILANTWTARGALTAARRTLAAFGLGGGALAAGGGTGGSLTVSGVVEFFDPAANTWTAKTALNTARSKVGGAVGFNTYGYVVGGTAAGADQATVEEYDPTTNAWTTLTGGGALTLPRSFTRCALSGRYLYAPGGQSGGTPQTPAYRLNTSPQPPVTNYAAVYADRLFFWGDPNNPSDLYWMDVGEIDAWDPRFKMRIDDNDGDWGTALFKWQDALYACKRDGVWRVTGRRFDPDLTKGDQTKQWVCGNGPVNKQSVVITPDAVYWRGEEGFCRFDGSRSTVISRGTWDENRAMQSYVYNAGPSGVYAEWADEVRWYTGRASYSPNVTYASQVVPVLNVANGQWTDHEIALGAASSLPYNLFDSIGPVAAPVEDAWSDRTSILALVRFQTTGAAQRLGVVYFDTGSGDAAFGSARLPTAEYVTTAFSPGGLWKQAELTRAMLETSEPVASVTIMVQADRQSGTTEQDGPMRRHDSGKYSFDRLSAKGEAFFLRLRWQNAWNRLTIVKNLAVFAHVKGGGQK